MVGKNTLMLFHKAIKSENAAHANMFYQSRNAIDQQKDWKVGSFRLGRERERERPAPASVLTPKYRIHLNKRRGAYYKFSQLKLTNVQSRKKENEVSRRLQERYENSRWTS